MGKQEDYLTLVRARQACQRCEPMTNPARRPNDIPDSESLGPWSRWQGNVDAKVVIVGQDWGDVRYYVNHAGHDDPRTPTNKNLVALLDSIGITIAPPGPADSGGGTIFLTNAILYLKTAVGLQGAVMRRWFDNCGRHFLKPTIELVQPRALITMGEWAYRSVRLIYGLPRVGFRTAVSAPEGITLPGGTRLFPMYHYGQRVLNTKIRGWEQQMIDWSRVRRVLNTRR